MLDTKKAIVNALELTGLPVYFEQTITELTVPCITYLVLGDSVNKYGDTLGYSDITYRVKLWATTVQDLATYSTLIDTQLRTIGLKRTGYNESVDGELIVGIFSYEGLVRENFN